jgi:putative hydrolase of the HAD superfamily
MSVRSFLFFDLDRTLWDFERNSLETLQGLFLDFDLKQHGVRDFDAFNVIYQEENRKCWADYQCGVMTKAVLRGERFRRTLDILGLDQALAEGLGEAYVARGPHQRHLLDGALEVLATLQARGYPLHILTNGFKEVQHIKVENSGIGRYIDAVWTSDELGSLKPARACFDGALKGVGATCDEAWMIGDDHEADVIGAHQSGWRAIHFAPDGETPKTSPAVASVRHLRDLLALLP